MTCELCDTNVPDLCQHLYDAHIPFEISKDGASIKRCWCKRYYNCEQKNCYDIICRTGVLSHLRTLDDPVKHLLEAQLTAISKIGDE